MLTILKICCYSGCLLAFLIFLKLFRIQNLTFVNKMFVLYFFLDSILGSLEIFSMFKVFEDKDSMDEIQKRNCSNFITIWIVCVNRSIFHTLLIFLRLHSFFTHLQTKNILFQSRSIYVKYAQGLLLDGLSLLHILTPAVMFLMSFHTILLWPARIYFNPEKYGYEKWIKGMFCMRTNLTQDDLDQISSKPTMIAITFSILHVLIIVSCCVSSSRAK